jgi:protein ImuB
VGLILLKEEGGQVQQRQDRPNRYLVVALPGFRLERCGYPSDEPAALLAEQHQVLRLISCTPASRARGLKRGMSVNEARALDPETAFELLDESAEAEDRRSLLRVMEQFSDHLGILDEQRLVLLVQNTAHLWGGEPALLASAREVLEELGHCSRLVIASELATAAAVARWGEHDRVLQAEEGRRALAELPLEALEVDRRLLSIFHDLGLRTVGALAALPAASVGSRFGEEGRLLHRRACAESDNMPLLALRSPQQAQAGLVFGYELCSTERLKPVLPSLLQHLCQQLAVRGEAVMTLRCRLITAKQTPTTLWIRPGRPTRSAKRLRTLLEARLESVRLEAPLVELRLDVIDEALEPSWQLGLLNRAETKEPLDELLARLEHALGEERVFAVERVGRWLPEGIWRKRRLGAPLAQEAPLAKLEDVVDRQESPEPWSARRRPNLLLSKPYPIQIERDDSSALRALHTPRGRLPIYRATGPERLQGEWWTDERGFRRDYWVVDLGGRAAWIYQSNTRWYLHGWFD